MARRVISKPPYPSSGPHLRRIGSSWLGPARTVISRPELSSSLYRTGNGGFLVLPTACAGFASTRTLYSPGWRPLTRSARHDRKRAVRADLAAGGDGQVACLTHEVNRARRSRPCRRPSRTFPFTGYTLRAGNESDVPQPVSPAHTAKIKPVKPRETRRSRILSVRNHQSHGNDTSAFSVKK